MNESYYMINMQKLLYIVKELYNRGFEKLRVIPSVAPSGLHWRCSFLSGNDSERRTIITSNWIQDFYNVQEKIEFSIGELTDMFEKEHFDFLILCKGENKDYVDWYSDMLLKLKEGELPYAYSDYSSPGYFWETTQGQKIYTLPNEKQNYMDY